MPGNETIWWSNKIRVGIIHEGNETGNSWSRHCLLWIEPRTTEAKLTVVINGNIITRAQTLGLLSSDVV